MHVEETGVESIPTDTLIGTCVRDLRAERKKMFTDDLGDFLWKLLKNQPPNWQGRV